MDETFFSLENLFFSCLFFDNGISNFSKDVTIEKKFPKVHFLDIFGSLKKNVKLKWSIKIINQYDFIVFKFLSFHFVFVFGFFSYIYMIDFFFYLLCVKTEVEGGTYKISENSQIYAFVFYILNIFFVLLSLLRFSSYLE